MYRPHRECGPWVWLDGSGLTEQDYAVWDTMPQCGAVRGSSAKWYTLPCEHTTTGFVCEKGNWRDDVVTPDASTNTSSKTSNGESQL